MLSFLPSHRGAGRAPGTDGSGNSGSSSTDALASEVLFVAGGGTGRAIGLVRRLVSNDNSQLTGQQFLQ